METLRNSKVTFWHHAAKRFRADGYTLTAVPFYFWATAHIEVQYDGP